MPQLKIYDDITSTWRYVSAPGQIVTVSPDAPIAPLDGALWWDTDDASLLVDTIDPVTLANNAAFTGKYAPFSIGLVGLAEVTANWGPVTGIADINGLGITFNAAAGRRYRAKVFLPDCLQNTAAGQCQVFITDGTNVILNRGVFNAAAAQAFLLSAEALFTATGSYTVKARSSTSAGNMTMTGSATERMMLIVEDIGHNP